MKHILVALWLSLFTVFVFHGCVVAPVVPTTTTAPVQQAGNCAMVSETLKLANQTIVMPATGKVVLESHLATTEDTFPVGRLFPNSSTENIAAHVARSCKLFNAGTTCGPTVLAQQYASKYVNEWTPPEGGVAGQGSVGNLKPTPLEEMYSGNMFWTSANKPKPGTRFLASSGSYSIVIAMGYETGPQDAQYIGGLQGEVIYELGGQDKITIGRLKDQSLALGPINCQ